MQIKDRYGDINEVFAIYWFKDETYFSVLPRDQGGLLSFRQREVEVIDSKINFRTMFSHNNANMIAHWALIEKNLFDGVQDYDEEAYLEFLKIIKEEGLVPPDFY